SQQFLADRAVQDFGDLGLAHDGSSWLSCDAICHRRLGDEAGAGFSTSSRRIFRAPPPETFTSALPWPDVVTRGLESKESAITQDTGGRYDAVIVGAGHNGLTAAAYLARAGRTVLVLERLD